MPLDFNKLPVENKEGLGTKLYRWYTHPITESLGVDKKIEKATEPGLKDAALETPLSMKDRLKGLILGTVLGNPGGMAMTPAEQKGMAAGSTNAVTPALVANAASLAAAPELGIVKHAPRLINAIAAGANATQMAQGTAEAVRNTQEGNYGKAALDALTAGLGGLGTFGSARSALRTTSAANTAASLAKDTLKKTIAAQRAEILERIANKDPEIIDAANRRVRDAVLKEQYPEFNEHTTKYSGGEDAKAVFGPQGRPKPLSPIQEAIASQKEAAADVQAADALTTGQQQTRKATEKALDEGFKNEAASSKPLVKAQAKQESVVGKAQVKAIAEDEKRTAQNWQREAGNEEARDTYLENLRKERAKAALAETKKTAKDWAREATNLNANEDAAQAIARKEKIDLAKQGLEEGPARVSETTSATGPAGEKQTLRKSYVEPAPPEGEAVPKGEAPVGPPVTDPSHPQYLAPEGKIFPRTDRGKNAAVELANANGGHTKVEIVKAPGQDGAYLVRPKAAAGGLEVTPEMAKNLGLPPEVAGTPVAAPEAVAKATPAVAPKVAPQVKSGAPAAIPEVPADATPASSLEEALGTLGKGPQQPPKSPKLPVRARAKIVGKTATPQKAQTVVPPTEGAGDLEASLAKLGGSTVTKPTVTFVSHGPEGPRYNVEGVKDYTGPATVDAATVKKLGLKVPKTPKAPTVTGTEKEILSSQGRPNGEELRKQALAARQAATQTSANPPVSVPGDTITTPAGETFKVPEPPPPATKAANGIHLTEQGADLPVTKDIKAIEGGANIERRLQEGKAPDNIERRITDTNPAIVPEAPIQPNPPRGVAPIISYPETLSPLAKAGEEYSQIRGLKKAGLATEEARSAAGARAAAENTPAARAGLTNEDLGIMPGNVQDKVISQIVKDEKGGIDPALALRLGGGVLGGAIGSQVDPEHPYAGAALGAGLGSALPSPSQAATLKTLGEPYVKKAINAVNQLHNTALLGPYSVAKKGLADVGGLSTYALLHPGSAGDILKQFTTPEGRQLMKQSFHEGFMGPQDLALTGMENYITNLKNPLSWAGRTMGGLTKATKNILGEAGATVPEQSEYTLTSEPTTALGKSVYNAFRNPVMAHFSPFARIGVNRMERGFEYSPLGFFNKAGTPEQNVLAAKKALLGTGVMAGAAYLTPDDYVKEHPRAASMISALAGPLSIPVLAAMAIKNAHINPDEANNGPWGNVGNFLKTGHEASKEVARDIPGLRLLEDIDSSTPEATLRNYLSGYTNALAPYAEFLDPERPDVSSRGLPEQGKIFNRMLANVPFVRSTLPRQDGSIPPTLEQVLSGETR